MSRLLIIAGGVLCLILAGLYALVWQEEEAPLASTKPRARPSPVSPPEGPRPPTAPSASGPGPVAATPPPPSGSPTAPPPASASADTAEIERALATARQDAVIQQRIEALRWLGQHGTPAQFEALQQIQIQDPAPEVRKAAEASLHVLTARFLQHDWPGVPRDTDPFGYMRDAP